MSEQKTAAKPADEVIAQTPIADLSPSKQNLRTRVGDIKGLQRSIEDSGILEPLIARWTTDGEGDDDVPYLEVVAGHRRLEAAKRAGFETVPVVIRTITDAGLSKAMLIENMQREELSPLEEATGYLRLVSDHEMTVKDLAKAVGRSQRHVSERLRLLDLPDAVSKKMDAGDMPLSALQAFETLTSHDLWDDLDEEAQEQAISSLTNNWQYPDRVIERTFRPLIVGRVFEQVREKAEKKGMRFVEPKSDYGELVPAGKILGEAPERDRYHADRYLSVDVKAHRNEPCHALSVYATPLASGERKLKAVEVCTDQGRHTRKNAPSEVLPENYEQVQAERQAEREERAREKAEAKARTEAKGRMVQSLRKTDAYTLVGRLVIDDASMTACRQAARLLSIEEAVQRPHPWEKDKTEDDWRQTLRDLSEKSDADRSRVALALMLADVVSFSMHDDTKTAIAEAMKPFEVDES